MSDNRLPKAEDSDLTREDFELARDLMRYYRNSFNVRCAGMMSAEIDPPEVRDLVNFLQWCGGGYALLDLGRHVLVLSEIVANGAEEVREMIEYVRTNGADQRVIADIQYAQLEMEAADTLMGYLVDG